MNRLALIVMLLIPAAAGAQQPGAVQREAMKKLDFLVGKWEGPASYQIGKGKMHSLRQSEEVQYRLKGTVLLVEGTGRRTEGIPAGGDDNIAFNALGVISYDPEVKQYRIKTHTMEGRTVETELKLVDRGVVWGFKTPKNSGEVRHTMKLNDKGEWYEVSEFSPDGKTWYKTVEMTLTRAKE
jgi:hypothetical protein